MGSYAATLVDPADCAGTTSGAGGLMTDTSIGTAELLARAAAGDAGAWQLLVDRHLALLWAVARSFRLSRADCEDVVQTTLLRLVENLDRITEPDRLVGWLATTARRECLRLLRRSGRERPVAEDTALEREDVGTPAVDAALLASERDAAVWAAFQRISARCQQLLRLAVAEPEPYELISSVLEMPVGSIGPTRRRCLERLRALLDESGWTGSGEAR